DRLEILRAVSADVSRSWRDAQGDGRGEGTCGATRIRVGQRGLADGILHRRASCPRSRRRTDGWLRPEGGRWSLLPRRQLGVAILDQYRLRRRQQALPTPAALQRRRDR